MLAPEVCSCDVEKLTAKIRFRARKWEKNLWGEIHGGAISAMFDTSIGMTVMGISAQDRVFTVDLGVSFIRPFTGESFIFDVEVVHSGKTLARARAIACDEETGKCLAIASSNYTYGR